MRKFKITAFILAGMFCSLQTWAQHWCATDEMNQRAYQNNPEAILRMNALQKFTENYEHEKLNSAEKGAGVLKVIPIVFHVLHLGGAENISDAQIIDAVEILNRDYQKLNSDTTLVIPEFENIVGDVQFEFRLATIDPNGNCTNGITRHYDAKTNWDRSSTNNNGYNNYVYTWNPTKYLNIYVVKSITGNAAGYTYLPGTWPTNSNRDAIVALHDYVGSIGTSSTTNERTLTHEVGHWFNLQHTWGSTNQPGVSCGDDQVGDTPETVGSTSCNLNLSICNPPQKENVQNYMDYSYCTRMFTMGQATRMNAAAASSVSGRNNLWTSSNLSATGTSGGPAPVCAPIASFSPKKRFVCAGGSLTFNSWAHNASTIALNWSFPGGTPASDTAANPSIQYNTLGLYDVTMVAGNSSGSDTLTYYGLVKVVPAQGILPVPFSESFETMTFPGTDWDSTNSGGTGWAISTAAAYTGTKAMRLSNYSGNAVGYDEFATPAYDLSWITSPSLTFRLAHANKVNSSSDNLKVYVSVDCGKTWTLRYNKTGSSLATAGVVTAAFTPTQASQWRLETVPALSSYAGQPAVRFLFSYNYTGDGNNAYIDDINITGTVGINDVVAGVTNMNLYPNPSNGQTNLSFSVEKNSDASLIINDIAGRIVSAQHLGMLGAGPHQILLDQNLNKGLYFVRLVIDGKPVTQRLIIN